jgi:hypothetical protein
MTHDGGGRRGVSVGFRNRIRGGGSYFWICLVWQVEGRQNRGKQAGRDAASKT